MNPKITELAPQIKEAVGNSQNILLHCHPNADPDSAGSSLAWMYYLKTLGKNVTIIMGDNDPSNGLKTLPGFDQIVMKNYFEIDPNQFDLFIINDSSDLTRVSSKAPITFPQNLKTIVIDHHPSNPHFGQINLIVDEYIANGQIVYELFKIWNVEITKEIAANLLMAIFTDSGGLKFAPTDSQTIQDFAELVEKVPDYHDIIFKYENSKERDELKFQGLVLNSIEEYFSNQVAISAISLDRMIQNKINPKNAMGMATKLISVPDWKIGITMLEKDRNVVFVSLRTADPDQFNLSEFAVSVGGGGHKAAAGANLRMPLPDAKRLILDKLAELFPELGNAY